MYRAPPGGGRRRLPAAIRPGHPAPQPAPYPRPQHRAPRRCPDPGRRHPPQSGDHHQPERSPRAYPGGDHGPHHHGHGQPPAAALARSPPAQSGPHPPPPRRRRGAERGRCLHPGAGGAGRDRRSGAHPGPGGPGLGAAAGPGGVAGLAGAPARPAGRPGTLAVPPVTDALRGGGGLSRGGGTVAAGHHRQPARADPRRGRDGVRLRSGPRRAARAVHQCRPVPPGPRDAGARTHGHRQSQGRLQPDPRPLYRGEPHPVRAGPGRVRAAPNPEGRRALHHTGAQAFRGSGTERPGTRPGQGKGALRGAAATVDAMAVGATDGRRRHRVPGRALQPGGTRRYPELGAAGPDRRAPHRDRRRPPSGDRTGARRPLRGQRGAARRRPTHAGDHRTQYGGQIHLHAADGPDRAHGLLRRLRARPFRSAGTRGPHLLAHRRRGRPGRRALDLPGGDGGDGQYPAQRERAQPGADGRGRPRHQHLRWPLPGLGLRQRAGDAQPRLYPVRHPLLRAHHPVRGTPRNRQCAPGRRGARGLHRLHACGPGGPGQPELWAPGGKTGRGTRRGHRARPYPPAPARGRRTTPYGTEGGSSAFPVSAGVPTDAPT